MDLPEFLLARITEDEERARRVGTVDHPLDQANYFRVLAECEAKRQIIAVADDRHGGPNWRDAIDYAMRSLAEPYADHPDYREEWRP